MTARKTTDTAAAAGQAPLAAWSAESDGGRQQMAVATESAGAMLRGFEAMRKINDRALQGALARYTAAAGAAPRQPLDLFTMPSDFVRGEIEGATSYLQELSAAALEMQAELLGCSSHLVDSDALLQAASAVNSLPRMPAFNGFPHLNGFEGFNSFFGARPNGAATQAGA
ncbi:MAG: hypothetical protein JWQ13_859 [Ramlibacter sp.]|nr:hypothetical protein [Ramlibacter sp.]